MYKKYTKIEIGYRGNTYNKLMELHWDIVYWEMARSSVTPNFMGTYWSHATNQLSSLLQHISGEILNSTVD